MSWRHYERPSNTESIWNDMWRRCIDPRREDYSRYGGRGITVCDRWKSFEDFLVDMGPRPEGLTLERKDNKVGYSKENCVWATRAEQNINKGGYKNNTSGISGVSYDTRYRLWLAHVTRQGTRKQLYRGEDFFEACCARKGWEDKNARH